MIISELESGLRPNYSLDIFGVVVASHFASIFSNSAGTYVLYTVPLYCVYKVGGFALSYLKSKSESATTAQEVELNSVEAKRKAKKERQEKRAEKMGAFKYSKQ